MGKGYINGCVYCFDSFAYIVVLVLVVGSFKFDGHSHHPIPSSESEAVNTKNSFSGPKNASTSRKIVAIKTESAEVRIAQIENSLSKC
jgi:hypothetical protein